MRESQDYAELEWQVENASGKELMHPHTAIQEPEQSMGIKALGPNTSKETEAGSRNKKLNSLSS